MSNYLCQDCKSNKNGWCTVRKCNGLKKMNITSCNTFESIQIKNTEKIDSTLKTLDEHDARLIGKREMLWTIQRQILAIKKDESLNDSEKFNKLVKTFKNLCIIQNDLETLFKLKDNLSSEIDDAMIQDSVFMTNLL